MTETLPRATLLEVPNHHRTTDGGTNYPPEFPAAAFVAYMPNEHGEQMVYVHKRGQTPLLYHGDYAWHPVEVGVLGQVDLIVHEAEAAFLYACRKASRYFDDEAA